MKIKWVQHKSAKYLEFVRSIGCMVCGVSGVDAHHMFNAKRNDYLAVPLCRKHHSEYHSIGVDTFKEKHNLDYANEIITTLIAFINRI